MTSSPGHIARFSQSLTVSVNDHSIVDAVSDVISFNVEHVKSCVMIDCSVKCAFEVRNCGRIVQSLVFL